MSLGPIILHTQKLDAIVALEEYFQSKCVKRIRSDGKNFYIDFNPIHTNSTKLKDFVSSEFVLSYKGESFPFTHQFYDL
jgi:hypothetical protein